MNNRWLEAAKKIRNTMDAAGALLTDEQAATVPELFRPWEENSAYVVGDRRLYKNVLYRCLTAHTAQSDWNPVDAPSLWTKILIPDENTIYPWEQPDSTNTYKIGDKVTHNGKTWISVVDNNSWEPGVYGWEEVIDKE